MAIWQFKVSLIPQSWIASGHDLQSLFDDAGYDVSRAWNGYRDSDLAVRLGSILPTGKSWHDALLMWGSDEGNDIQLWRIKTAISDIAIRFDLRHPDIGLFQAITQLARDYELAIIDLAGRRVVAADTAAALRAAAESDAAHYVIDPLSFLSQLDSGSVKTT